MGGRGLSCKTKKACQTPSSHSRTSKGSILFSGASVTWFGMTGTLHHLVVIDYYIYFKHVALKKT